MSKKYYKTETEKALNNFNFSYHKVNWNFIESILKIKIATAFANSKINNLDSNIAKAIVWACQEILKGKLKDQFLLPALEGGAGTSINMNVNEVVASLAEEYLKGKKVHFLDHVNLNQSTNDVCPSALRITTYFLLKDLQKTLYLLIKQFEIKSKEFNKIKKLSRTHLQDSVPITLGKEFLSYANIIASHKKHLERIQFLMLELNLGGTIIGDKDSTSLAFKINSYKELKRITGVNFHPAKNLMSKTSSLGDFLIVSQSLIALGVDLSKIASDIRLMSSGPNGGFGELVLADLQKGSSFMPGKVNPIICELVNQWYFLVSGNNLMIEKCAESGQLELNTMFPLVSDKLLESLSLSKEILQIFSDKCIKTMKANKEKCLFNLENSTALAIYFVPLLGYDRVERIVKESYSSKKSFKELILEQGISEKQWRDLIK